MQVQQVKNIVHENDESKMCDEEYVLSKLQYVVPQLFFAAVDALFLRSGKVDIILDDCQIDGFRLGFFLVWFSGFFRQINGSITNGWLPEVSFAIDDTSGLQPVLFSQVNGDDYRFHSCVDNERFINNGIDRQEGRAYCTKRKGLR